MITPSTPEPSGSDAELRPGPRDELGAVFVYGALRKLSRTAVSEKVVNAAGRIVRTPGSADTVVVAGAALPACFQRGGAALPFARRAGSRLLSEAAFRTRLGVSSRRRAGPRGSGAYAAAEVARLAALPLAAVEVLTGFDVLGDGEEVYCYADLAEARQVAALLRQGHDLKAVIVSASQLAERGLRLSQVRLAEAPWGGLAQTVGDRLARLDGQFALGLDESRAPASDSLALALASEAAGAVEEAERQYRRAGQVDRRDPVPLFNLANLVASRGRDPEAAMLLQQALARDPDFAEAEFNLAELHEKAGRADRAIGVLQGAVSRHPHYAQAHYNLARLLTLARRFGDAVPAWDAFIALAPEDPDLPHARRGALLCRLEMRRTEPSQRSSRSRSGAAAPSS